VLNELTLNLNELKRTTGGRSVAYTVLVWSRLNVPVELSTRYTTPDTTIEIWAVRNYECDRGIRHFDVE